MRHTLDMAATHSKGLPEYGIELAEDLERMVALHDASTIAAVIIEPIAGSAGVIIPPDGYLKRIRELCTKHGILLIFDEVITGFGRVGNAFAAQRFNVIPDMITAAKGLTNGCVPMGVVLVSDDVHDAFAQGPDNAIDLFHGYTYSAIRWPAPRRLPPWIPMPRKTCSTRRSNWRLLAGGHPFAERPAQCHRYPQIRPDRRHRTGATPRRAGHTGLRRLHHAFQEGNLLPG